jgi:hypothetical protein
MNIAALAALLLSATSPPDVTASRATCSIVDVALVELEGHSIRIGDVVDLACLAPDVARTISTLELAQTPPHRRDIALSHAAIASLARRRAPILQELQGETDRTLLVRSMARNEGERAASDETTAPNCFALASPLREGHIVTGEILASAPCTDTSPRDIPLSFDRRSGALRARHDLPQGVYLGRVDVPAQRYPDTGDALNLIVPNGPVLVQRTVIALEPAPRRGALFVRDESGEIFSAPLRPDDQGSGR